MDNIKYSSIKLESEIPEISRNIKCEISEEPPKLGKEYLMDNVENKDDFKSKPDMITPVNNMNFIKLEKEDPFICENMKNEISVQPIEMVDLKIEKEYLMDTIENKEDFKPTPNMMTPVNNIDFIKIEKEDPLISENMKNEISVQPFEMVDLKIENEFSSKNIWTSTTGPTVPISDTDNCDYSTSIKLESKDPEISEHIKSENSVEPTKLMDLKLGRAANITHKDLFHHLQKIGINPKSTDYIVLFVPNTPGAPSNVSTTAKKMCGRLLNSLDIDWVHENKKKVDRERKRQRIKEETEEERKRRLEILRNLYRRKRNEETEEEKRLRQQKQREYVAKRRKEEKKEKISKLNPIAK